MHEAELVGSRNMVVAIDGVRQQQERIVRS